LEPANEQAHLALAENYLRLGKSDHAQRILQQLDSTDCADSQIYFELKARCAAATGNSLRAIEYWKSAISSGTQAESAYLNIASQYIIADDLPKARLHLQVRWENSEQHERAKIISARCCIKDANWEKGIAILRNLDQFERLRNDAAALLFQFYMNDQRDSEAKLLCELLKNEGHPAHHLMQGKIQYKLYRYSEAIESFRLSLNSSDDIESKIWLIKTLHAIQDENSAVATAQLKEITGSQDFISQGRCWEAAGKLTLARECFKKAVRVEKGYKEYSTLANFYFKHRDFGKSYYTLKQASKHGLRSELFDALEQKIVDAFSLTGFEPPRSLIKLSRADFMVSEVMVKSIVDMAIRKAGNSLNADNRVNQIENSVLVINSLGAGGAERQVVNLANGLSRCNEVGQVNLLCTHLSRTDQDRFYKSQVNGSVVITEYFQRAEIIDPYSFVELRDYADYISHIQPVSRQQVILHLAKKLIAIKPDVVHGWLDETFINTSLVCAMLGIRNVVGRWGSMPPGDGRDISEKERSNVQYLKSAYREIARLPFLKYTSNSYLTGRAYAQMMGIDQSEVEIVYNGVEKSNLEVPEDSNRPLRLNLGIPDHSKVVGTIFRISEEKRPKLWIDVAVEILKAQPETHFIIVGAGPLESVVADYIDELSVTNIHMVGKQDKVGIWYELFDVVLMTSRVEGVSNVVIESQHCGKPVVAPRVGGMPEAIVDGQTGVLLDDHAACAIAEAVSGLLVDDRLRERLGANAKKYAQNKFSIPVMVSNYLEIFQK